jgi:hypothetical protein
VEDKKKPKYKKKKNRKKKRSEQNKPCGIRSSSPIANKWHRWSE